MQTAPPSSQSSSCRDHSPAPLCDPRPWFLGVSSWRCLQALSLLRGRLASACLKGHLCRLANKRGPGAASCEWARYRPGAPSATSPSPQSRGACAGRSGGSDHRAKILSILRVPIRHLPAAGRHVRRRVARPGARAELVFSTRRGFVFRHPLFWQRNAKLIARTACLLEPPEAPQKSVLPRCRLPFPPYRGRQRPPGRPGSWPSSPAGCQRPSIFSRGFVLELDKIFQTNNWIVKGISCH